MKWFTRNKESIPITPKTIRDVSDDENPVTFATGLDDSEREKELEEFGEDKKADFNTNPDYSDEETAKRTGYNFQGKDMSENTIADEREIWKELESEIKEIENDKSMTLKDKTILLFKIYDEYEKQLPLDIANRLFLDIKNLDSQLQEKKREDMITSREEKLHDNIKSLKSKISDNRLKSRNIPVKDTDDMSPNERKKVESKSHEKIEDWEHVASLLILEAESM